jgi:SNF2-related domain
MARLRREERFWKERVQQWAASGLSAREFASREGLRKERLFFWKRRLRASSPRRARVSGDCRRSTLCRIRAHARSARRRSAPQRERILADAHQVEMLLSSYHTVWRDADAVVSALDRRPWLVVLDEAHYVKSMHGALATAVRQIAPHANRRMVLTGTPMPKSPEDLWTPFTFLWPTEALLGNATGYAIRCRQPPDALAGELRVELAPFFHRTCKEDLGLPPVDATYPVIPAEDLPRSQRLLLRLVERRTLEEATYLNPRDRAHLRRWRRARVVRLMQAASNPLMLADALDLNQVLLADDDADAPPENAREGFPLTDVDSALAATLARYEREVDVPAKVAYVVQRCRALVAAGHKVVIWTVFLRNVALLAELLEDLAPLCITGAVPLYESDDDESGEQTREQRIELFKTKPDRRVLIANMAAYSESVSLHRACQHAIYLERSFNAAQFVQSLDRIHRQGMPHGTTAHVEIPNIPCAIERVLDRRLRERQARLYRLLNDPMPIVGFDDDLHRGLFDVEDADDLDALFAEVLAEIRLHLAEEPD